MRMRADGSNGHRAAKRPAVRRRLAEAAPPPVQDAAEAANEAALAAWLCAALQGIALGLAVAKYGQAWARTALHPTAVLGTAVVLLSFGLAVAAAARHTRRAARAGRGAPPRALPTLGLAIAALLAWGALALIAFAGWEFPPARPR